MKIKQLIILLGLMSSLMGYAQSYAPEVYRVPARREIQGKLSSMHLEPVYELPATRATGDYLWQDFPTQGEMHGVVLLVAFKDVPFGLPDDSLRTLLQARYDGDRYSESLEYHGFSSIDNDSMHLRVEIPGSARDYFRDQSMGQFTPRFDVVGPVTLDSVRAYYGANTKSGNDKNARAMVVEACRKAYEQELVDYAQYDADDNGVVDFVYVVYAGSDEAQTAIEECVWAHSSSMSLSVGDMKMGRYACSGELFIDLPGLTAGIGTFVHEFSHILGLPDYYNTVDGASTKLSMDVWSVMDYGMYNRGGFVPCAYTAFERHSLGWLPMTTLEAPATMSIGTTEEEGTGYRIFVSDDSTAMADTSSFYLVETIRKEGWNRYAYAEGLLISQVTYKASAWQNNKVNTEDAYRHYVVPANNHWSIVNGYNPTKHLYGTANHEFTLTSVPASITQAGAAMNKPLTDINFDAGTGRTTFHFRGGSGVKMHPADKGQRAAAYDLLGRPVQGAAEGVVIRNGRKFF